MAGHLRHPPRALPRRSRCGTANDPILKERMFGLTGPQGNHGEDVKEYWWYLEGAAEPRLLRWRYHYPQAAFPYEQLVAPRPRPRTNPEFELLDTGCLRRRPLLVGRRHLREGLTDRGADADRAREPRAGRGDAAGAADALVPQHVVVRRRRRRGRGSRATARRSRSPTTALAGYRLDAAPGPDGVAARAAVLRERDERATRLRRRRRRRRTRRTGSTTTSSRARRRSTRTASARRRALLVPA